MGLPAFADGLCVCTGACLQCSSSQFAALPWLSLPACTNSQGQPYKNACSFAKLLGTSHFSVFPCKIFGQCLDNATSWSYYDKWLPLIPFNKWPSGKAICTEQSSESDQVQTDYEDGFSRKLPDGSNSKNSLEMKPWGSSKPILNLSEATWLLLSQWL